MLSSDKIIVDPATGYNYQDSINSIRQETASSGGLSQLSDDQIYDIIRQKSHFASVKWAGADITDESDDPYGWGTGLELSDIEPLAAELSAKGLTIDVPTLTTLLKAEVPYALSINMCDPSSEIC